MKGDYPYNKKWRKSNPSVWRRQKQRYYDQHGQGRHNGQDWSDKEKQLVMSPNSPGDVILAKRLGRSVRAIQIKRCRLKKEIQASK